MGKIVVMAVIAVAAIAAGIVAKFRKKQKGRKNYEWLQIKNR